MNSGKNFKSYPIYDGDIIKVEKAKKISKSEKIAISKSNFMPEFISVNFIGEVGNPGIKKIKPNSPISYALEYAGGIAKTGSKSKIRLYRLNLDGSVQVFSNVDLFKSESNFIIENGDVVAVERNNLTKITDGLETIVKPFNPIVNANNVYRLLSND